MAKPEPSLAKLPQELIDNITQYSEYNDLDRLSMTCRLLRAAVFPKLFEDIKMAYKSDNEEPFQRFEPRTVPYPRVYRLLLTILERRDLASLVKSIDLQLRGFRGSRRKWMKPLILPKKYRHDPLFGYAMEKTEFQRTQWWMSAIEKNGLDFIALLFICVCPNLEFLSLGLDVLQENDLCGDRSALHEERSSSRHSCPAIQD